MRYRVATPDTHVTRRTHADCLLRARGDISRCSTIASRFLLEPFVLAGVDLHVLAARGVPGIVGFLFRRTRVMVFIPFHRTLKKSTLRFYVRRTVAGEVRRGVTFIRELVPRTAIAFAAKALSQRTVQARSMRHRIRASVTRCRPSNTRGTAVDMDDARAAVSGEPSDLVAGRRRSSSRNTTGAPRGNGIAERSSIASTIHRGESGTRRRRPSREIRETCLATSSAPCSRARQTPRSSPTARRSRSIHHLALPERRREPVGDLRR